MGDKILYSLSALATAFRPGPILAGAAAAFALKMLVAVMFGQFIGNLPPLAVSLLSAATFFAMAVGFLLKRRSTPPQEDRPATRFTHPALVSFAAVFFTEWGDPGQLAAALLVAQGTPAPVVWCGAVLAMLSKAVVGATLGIGLRRFLPERVIRPISVAMCATMGILAAFRIEL